MLNKVTSEMKLYNGYLLKQAEFYQQKFIDKIRRNRYNSI